MFSGKRMVALIVIAISMALFSSAAAASPQEAPAESSGTYHPSSAEQAELESDLKTVFGTYLKHTDSGWVVNDADAAAAAGVDAKKLAKIAISLNHNNTGDSAGVPVHAIGTKAWGLCVINIVFPGAGAGFVGGGFLAWLAKGKYAQVASYLLRVVGPAALKGGGVGLVAHLTAGAAWCSTPWAN